MLPCPQTNFRTRLSGQKGNHFIYELVGSTVKSYLPWLKDGGQVQTEFRDNLLWQKAWQ